MSIYAKRYSKIINHYKNTTTEGYSEKHHIVPKCMGGTNDCDNLVDLPAKAHYLVHWILTKMYPHNKRLLHAFAAMAIIKEGLERTYTSKQFARMKEARQEALRGIPRSAETKEKLHRANIGKVRSKESVEKTRRGNLGKIRTPEMIVKYKAAAHNRSREHWDKINISKCKPIEIDDIRYHSIKNAAEMLSKNPCTIREWLKKGKAKYS